MPFVSEQPEKQQSAELDEVSDNLTRGLKLCHSLVDDYRMKLAANPNLQAANDSDDNPDLG